jgi:hypothetical protein
VVKIAGFKNPSDFDELPERSVDVLTDYFTEMTPGRHHYAKTTNPSDFENWSEPKQTKIENFKTGG